MRQSKYLLAAITSTFLSACANFEPAKPDNYSGPLASIQDTDSRKSSSLTHMFYLNEVDGRRLKDSGVATRMANHGRGFSISAVNLQHQVPATNTKLKIVGSTAYAAPILQLTNPTCSISGVIDVNLEVGKAYRVNGSLTNESCSVWLESLDDGTIIGQRITGQGAK
jgi:hypothetical protein